MQLDLRLQFIFVHEILKRTTTAIIFSANHMFRFGWVLQHGVGAKPASRHSSQAGEMKQIFRLKRPQRAASVVTSTSCHTQFQQVPPRPKSSSLVKCQNNCNHFFSHMLRMFGAPQSKRVDFEKMAAQKGLSFFSHDSPFIRIGDLFSVRGRCLVLGIQPPGWEGVTHFSQTRLLAQCTTPGLTRTDKPNEGFLSHFQNRRKP